MQSHACCCADVGDELAPAGFFSFSSFRLAKSSQGLFDRGGEKKRQCGGGGGGLNLVKDGRRRCCGKVPPTSPRKKLKFSFTATKTMESSTSFSSCKQPRTGGKKDSRVAFHRAH